MTPEPLRSITMGALAHPLSFGHHRDMSKRKAATDARHVSFVAVPGSKQLYKEAAELEGMPLDAWIRSTLHGAATNVLEAHGRDTSNLPAVHIKRPPRLQPRYDDAPEDGTP